MSFDLYVWAAPIPRSAVEAGALLEVELEGSGDRFGADPRVRVFRERLLTEYPALEDLAEDADSPWAMTPSDSDRFIEMSVDWSADDAVLLRIVALARELGVVLYDPQGPDVHSPPGIPRQA